MGNCLNINTIQAEKCGFYPFFILDKLLLLLAQEIIADIRPGGGAAVSANGRRGFFYDGG